MSATLKLYAVVTGLGIATLCACDRPALPPEQELRHVVEQMVSAIEAHEAQTILRRVALEFTSADGLSYPDVEALVFKFVLGKETFRGRVQDLSIQPAERGDQRVGGRVYFSQVGTRGEVLAGSTVGYRVDLIFSRWGRTWQATRGSYERI